LLNNRYLLKVGLCLHQTGKCPDLTINQLSTPMNQRQIEILARLKRVGYAEGFSFLLLLAMMPLKYRMGWPLGVTVVGSIHGFLWVFYVCVIWQAKQAMNWGTKPLLFGLLASVLPFGPFVYEWWLRRKMNYLLPINNRQQQ